jgi:DNA-binding NarL/FixJ family response regulator
LTRILLVDDHDLVRAGVRALLERQPGLEVVGEAGDGKQAVSMVRQVRPDVVLMDVNLPGGLGGFEATEAILADFPETHVIFLTQYEDREYIQRALQVGAHGFLPKRAVAEQLVEAIERVCSGNRYLHPSATDELMRIVADGRSLDEDAYGTLTPRERQVFKLLAEGDTSREMAKYLGVSLKTAMTHRSHVMEKLGFHSRTELIKYAIRKGLIQIEAG